ncbi:MAG: DUF3783 domain-containing protein [Eubacteriales bacterium]|nr:DUF3783 domain-containing protein [Eubacteriales bacterium]
MEMQKKILGFVLKENQKNALSLLCESEHAVLIEIREKDFGKTLGALAKIGGFPAKPPVPVQNKEIYMVSGPMMVFCGFEQEELHGFLARYRQMQAEPVELKAMMTMHNIFWTPGMLYRELQEEHSAMMAYRTSKKTD